MCDLQERKRQQQTNSRRSEVELIRMVYIEVGWNYSLEVLLTDRWNTLCFVKVLHINLVTVMEESQHDNVYVKQKQVYELPTQWLRGNWVFKVKWMRLIPGSRLWRWHQTWRGDRRMGRLITAWTAMQMKRRWDNTTERQAIKTARREQHDVRVPWQGF